MIIKIDVVKILMRRRAMVLMMMRSGGGGLLVSEMESIQIIFFILMRLFIAEIAIGCLLLNFKNVRNCRENCRYIFKFIPLFSKNSLQHSTTPFEFKCRFH
jgi:hypothetical protein